MTKNQVIAFTLTLALFLFLVACGTTSGQPSGGAGAGTIVFSGTGGNCSPNADQVALYVDSDFDGQCVVLSQGDYKDAATFGLPDNSVSSVRVGANAQAVLCPDGDFGGQCETLKADDSTLADNTVIGDNEVSSLRVRPR
jgi:hypothetical protein